MRRKVNSAFRAPNCGFNLFELVMVLAIVAVLGAIAVPRYALATARYRADAAARRIVADLALARAKAYGSSVSKTVTFDLETNSVTIPGVRGLKSASVDYVTRFDDDPYRAKLVSADFGEDTVVVFDIYGRPDSSGQVVVESGKIRKTIVLDPDTGEASVQ